MSLGVLCALLLQAAPAPAAVPTPEPAPAVFPSPAPQAVYLLGAWRPPPPAGSGDGVQLVDLYYRASDEGGTRHAFAARLRLRQWAYFGVESEGERRGVSLQTARAALRLDEDDGSWRGFGSWRAPRVLAELDLRRRSAAEGRGLIVSGLGAGRLSADAEIVARFVGDTRPAPRRLELPERFLRAASLGVLWQRGASGEVFAEAGRARVRTPGGLEFERDELSLAAACAWRGAELSGELGHEISRGRFPHRQWSVGLSLRAPLAGRLLAEGATRQRFEPGLQRVTRDYDGALGLFARRVRLPRAGESARREAALARHAVARGYQERRVFGAAERLEQRRRLALRAMRGEFDDEILALHRAEVDERLAPLLGLDLSFSDDAVTGRSSWRYGVALGVPWPPAWPWHADESAAPFLRLRVARTRDSYSGGPSATGDELGLSADLSRETLIEARWGRRALTPLERVRNTPRARFFEIAYSYAFGR